MMPSHENLPRPSHPRAHRLHHALNPPLDPARNSEVPNPSSSSLGQVNLKSRYPRFKCSSTAMSTAPTTFAVSFESPGPFAKHFPPVTMPLLKPQDCFAWSASPWQSCMRRPRLHPITALDFCANRSEEHASELQSRLHLVCRLLLEKKKKIRQKQKFSRIPHTRY